MSQLCKFHALFYAVAVDMLVSVPQTNIPLIRNLQVECNLEGNYSGKHDGKTDVFAVGK
jgi:hypothetical protein